MTASGKRSDLLILLVICAALAAAVAYFVTKATSDGDSGSDVIAPLPPVALIDRQTVEMSAKTIVPVVSANAVVVQEGDAWLLEAPAPSADLAYRLLDPPVGVKALIDGGPSGFTCAWAGLGQAGSGEAMPVPAASQLGPATLNVTMRCEIPEDVRVVAGLTGTMVLQMDTPTEVQALPVTAVLGSFESGQVIVVHEDGATELRPVSLGVSDIYNIEIAGGLEPGEQVLAYPTQFDFSQAQSGASQ
ncbi:MAG: hypothetical protein AB7V46_01610 [Thermomicrobiales bacterium]